ncbi:MAG: hypothetical protein RLZZ282_1080 [Verrucomicrobiota bacterium]
MMAPTPMLCLALALSASTTLVRAIDPDESMVRFANGDQLGGAVVALVGDLLIWRSSSLERSHSFFQKNVIDLLLPSAPLENVEKYEAMLKLTNGDSLSGQLSSVTDEALVLDTRYAGRMTINRLMVAEVKITGKSAFVFLGPTGLDQWEQAEEKPAWTYRRGAFRSQGEGSIARDGLLTDACSITFDVAWKGDALGFKVTVFSDNPTSDGSSSGYDISFQRGSVYLKNNKTQSFLGSASTHSLMEKDRARIEIRASLKSGKVCLMIDERVVEVWTDPEVAKGKFGQCLQFSATSSSPLRVSRIGVTPWDGVVDQVPEPQNGILRQFNLRGLSEDEAKPAPTRAAAMPGRMELANGDSLMGEVGSINEGIIAVKTPLGEVKIPMERFRIVALKQVELERCKRRNGDIRAWFADGSSLVFRLDGMSDGSLIGSSQNFGSATFKITAFNRIEFNIYNPAFEKNHQAADW